MHVTSFPCFSDNIIARPFISEIIIISPSRRSMPDTRNLTKLLSPKSCLMPREIAESGLYSRIATFPCCSRPRMRVLWVDIGARFSCAMVGVGHFDIRLSFGASPTMPVLILVRILRSALPILYFPL